MAKNPKNHGRDWTTQDKKDFKKYVQESTPTRTIATKMGRTENSIRLYASNNGISLRPKKTAAKKTAKKAAKRK